MTVLRRQAVQRFDITTIDDDLEEVGFGPGERSLIGCLEDGDDFVEVVIALILQSDPVIERGHRPAFVSI
jgi:hypothetical protein